jgi:hypothetical protein
LAKVGNEWRDQVLAKKFVFRTFQDGRDRVRRECLPAEAGELRIVLVDSRSEDSLNGRQTGQDVRIALDLRLPTGDLTFLFQCRLGGEKIGKRRIRGCETLRCLIEILCPFASRFTRHRVPSRQEISPRFEQRKKHLPPAFGHSWLE